MHGLDTEKQVFFYEQEFYVFSNFSSFKLRWKGFDWMTSEHAYHSEKFDDSKILEELKNTRSAHRALEIATAYKDKRRKDWSDVKLGIMKDILRAKVEQHPYVKKKLQETGNKKLIENSWRDSYWGWGEDKSGENNLGKLWMEVREEMRHI